MSTFLIYGFVFTNMTVVDHVLQEIGSRLNTVEPGTVENMEDFLASPQDVPLNSSLGWFNELAIVKEYDEKSHQQVLLIYPKALKYVSTPGVTTVNPQVGQHGWGVAELFGAIMGWTALPQYYLVSL